MKKIALDLDGVVFDSENLFRVYAEIYDTDVMKKDSTVDSSKRKFQDVFDWPVEVCDSLLGQVMGDVASNANVMPGADMVINKLKDKYEFIIVTSRNDYEMSKSKDRLHALGLDNFKIFSNEHYKVDRYLKEKVDYIIDDDTSICLSAANNNDFKILFFKNNTSNAIDHPNVVNVRNWGEIYKYFILKEGGK